MIGGKTVLCPVESLEPHNDARRGPPQVSDIWWRCDMKKVHGGGHTTAASVVRACTTTRTSPAAVSCCCCCFYNNIVTQYVQISIDSCRFACLVPIRLSTAARSLASYLPACPPCIPPFASTKHPPSHPPPDGGSEPAADTRYVRTYVVCKSTPQRDMIIIS